MTLNFDPLGFPGGSDGKESTCSAVDQGSIPGLGRSPGEGNDYPLQYFNLQNSMDKGAWQAVVPGVVQSQTQLNAFHFHCSTWSVIITLNFDLHKVWNPFP